MNLIKTLFGRNAKFVAAIIGQALVIAEQTYGQSNHWVVMATAAAGALGVWAVPNQPAPAKAPIPPGRAM